MKILSLKENLQAAFCMMMKVLQGDLRDFLLEKLVFQRVKKILFLKIFFFRRTQCLPRVENRGKRFDSEFDEFFLFV